MSEKYIISFRSCYLAHTVHLGFRCGWVTINLKGLCQTQGIVNSESLKREPSDASCHSQRAIRSKDSGNSFCVCVYPKSSSHRRVPVLPDVHLGEGAGVAHTHHLHSEVPEEVDDLQGLPAQAEDEDEGRHHGADQLLQDEHLDPWVPRTPERSRSNAIGPTHFRVIQHDALSTVRLMPREGNPQAGIFSKISVQHLVDMLLSDQIDIDPTISGIPFQSREVQQLFGHSILF